MRATLTAVALALVVGLSAPACAYINQHTEECTVTDKDRTQNSEGVSEMRVYTTCGTYVVEDNFLAGFDSADLFGRLEQGKTYAITSGGARVGLLSMFPIIIEAQEI